MPKLPFDELQDFLDQQYDRYNRPSFIAEDPICIPHLFSNKEDIEISGFFSALIAWGRRDIIIRNARSLMERMDMEPYAFVLGASAPEMEKLSNFVHRTFNSTDCNSLVFALKEVYLHQGGLEAIFSRGIGKEDTDIGGAILSARKALVSHPSFQERTHKHLANPTKGSSAKRISMFLRWMVRKDKRGVDFGIWNKINMSQLICPLDVHTGNIARKLGILARKQNDWKAAIELTQALKKFDPTDPVKYDFALFGLGAYGEL